MIKVAYALRGGLVSNYLWILLLLVLTGCATTVAPSYTHFPQGGEGPKILIGARAVNGFYRDDIIISINGEDVLTGDITLWRLQDSLSGTYQDKEVKADCFAINDGIKTLTRHYCTVFIEGKKITRLAF